MQKSDFNLINYIQKTGSFQLNELKPTRTLRNKKIKELMITYDVSITKDES